MLETRIIGDAKQFGRALSVDLQEAKNLAVAVAFAKESALPVVDVEAWCGPGRTLRLLAGTDYALTELQLLRRLDISGNAQCRIYHSMGPRIFHPKLYLLEHERKRVVYIGSSNFTRGGLREILEPS